MLPVFKYQWVPHGGIGSVCKSSKLSSTQRTMCPSPRTIEGLLWMHFTPAPSGADSSRKEVNCLLHFEHTTACLWCDTAQCSCQALTVPLLLSFLPGLMEPWLYCRQDTVLQKILLDSRAVASNFSCFELLSQRRGTVGNSAYWKMQKSSV